MVRLLESALMMSAESPLRGTPVGDQLPAVFQSELPAIQFLFCGFAETNAGNDAMAASAAKLRRLLIVPRFMISPTPWENDPSAKPKADSALLKGIEWYKDDQQSATIFRPETNLIGVANLLSRPPAGEQA